MRKISDIAHTNQTNENMTTHTPGEWKADGCTIYSGETILAVTYCEGNRSLHNLHEKDTPPDSDGKKHAWGWEEAWRNADLIAAAPSLLNALIAIKTQAELTALTFPNAPGRGDLLTIAGIAGEAIAKAEGNA
jgi:hypothetical protein